MHVTRKSGRWLPVRIDDFEKWQASLLEESARRLGAVLAGSGRVYRWGFAGSPVTFRGQRAWLRVSPFLEHEMSRKAWRGTAEAAAIPGVSKPALLHRIEWHADGPEPVPVSAAHEAGLPMNIVVSSRNEHEIPQMKAIADRYGIPSFEFTNISPTIHGGGEVLASQAREVLRTRRPYTGCNAGITHFHADPHGRASICKIGRDPQVDLIAEGADGLRKLAAVADALVTRHGGCSGCALQKTCGTCMPLASLHRQAKAPLEVFCQHGRR